MSTIRLTLPADVNLMALPIRLVKICRNRVGSVRTLSGIPLATLSVSFRFFAIARDCRAERMSWNMA